MYVHVDPFDVSILSTTMPGDTTIQVAIPIGVCDGINFSEGEYFYLTLEGANGAERVRVDNCSGSYLTVTRGTPSLRFECGDAASIKLTFQDIKEIYTQCAKESGTDSDGADTGSVECTDVNTVPDSAYIYISDEDNCNECLRIKATDFKAWVNA